MTDRVFNITGDALEALEALVDAAYKEYAVAAVNAKTGGQLDNDKLITIVESLMETNPGSRVVDVVLDGFDAFMQTYMNADDWPQDKIDRMAPHIWPMVITTLWLAKTIDIELVTPEDIGPELKKRMTDGDEVIGMCDLTQFNKKPH